MQNSTIRQNLDFIFVILASLAFIGFVLYMAIHYPHVTVRYDCSISEISPDYPIQVKEACRQLRAGNILLSPK